MRDAWLGLHSLISPLLLSTPYRGRRVGLEDLAGPDLKKGEVNAGVNGNEDANTEEDQEHADDLHDDEGDDGNIMAIIDY